MYTGWQILKRKPYSAGALSASIDLFLILMELLIFKSSKNSNFEFIQQQSGCSFDGLARFNPSLTLFKTISSLSKILSHKESHSKNFGAFKIRKIFLRPTDLSRNAGFIVDAGRFQAQSGGQKTGMRGRNGEQSYRKSAEQVKVRRCA